MKNNAMRFLLILSLLLNASMLASAGYTHYQQSRHPGLPVGNVQKTCEETHAHLFEELSLASDKEALMRREADAFHAELDKKRREIVEKRAYLLNLMRADAPDENAIQGVIGEISGAQEEMQRAVAAHMLRFKSLLNRDQQRRFFELVEGAMAGKERAQCL